MLPTRLLLIMFLFSIEVPLESLSEVVVFVTHPLVSSEDAVLVLDDVIISS